MIALLRALRSEPRPGADEHARAPLSAPARLYLLTVVAITLSIAIPVIGGLGREEAGGWATFAVLAVAAALAQMLVVRLQPFNLVYHTSIVFLLCGAVLLPPELAVLMGVVQSIPEWLKERYAWTTQTFNVCNYTLDTLAAWGAFQLVTRADQFVPTPELRYAVGGLAACAAFVGLNHLLLGLMVRFATGTKLLKTGLFAAEGLAVELVLTGMGVALAAFWTMNPWLIPVAIGPLLVVHRSLAVPQLEAEARIDAKTGLFNARYFASALVEEFERSRRDERPVSVIMADLDLLREINNRYGHLAGDAVLRGVADVFRANLRHCDVPARFGGEEFSILLPGTSVAEAFEIAERIRLGVERQRFRAETSAEQIRATVSLGVAGFPDDAADAGELLHRADIAVYAAKLHGRNRTEPAGPRPPVSLLGSRRAVA